MNDTKGFDIQNGVLVKYRGRQKDVVIPDGVTEIGSWAFEKRRSLVSVSIPDGVKEIGRWAFSKCCDLVTVLMSNGVEKIGEEAFSECTSLTSLVIPDSVKWIGSSAFSGCSSLTSVKLHNSTEIYTHVFEGCIGLADSEGFLIIGETLYQYFGSETEIKIPENVKIIGAGAFYNCSNLKSVVLSAGLSEIGEYAFYGCETLKNVMIPVGVTEIGNSVFSGCGALTDINLPESVLMIGDSAFEDCTSLTNIVVPEEVKSIGHRAFAHCESLTSFTVPNSVVTLGHGAFDGCSKLENVVLSQNIPNIEGYTFRNCIRLKTLKLPLGVKSVCENSFEGCTSLTVIEIPESITEIGEAAFSGCIQLQKVMMPSSVKKIERSAFRYCSNLKEVSIKNLEAWCKISFAESEANPVYFSHSLLLNGRPVIKLEFPETLESIQPYSFVNCESIRSATIPANVKIIGDFAFSHCINLKAVSLSCGTTEIRSGSFSGCKGLRKLTIPESMFRIGDAAFRQCSNLRELKIPASVANIGNFAFSGCSSLERIEVSPDNSFFSSDQRGVLYNKTKTTLLSAPGALSGNYTIPSGVRCIKDNAFSGCSRITGLAIPDSVQEIKGYHAFEGCSGLEDFTIPQSVKRIGWGALVGIREIRVCEWSDMITDAVDEKTISIIHTDDLQKVPSILKKAAIAGFLKDSDIDRKSVRFKSHRAYLMKNMEKLIPFFFDHPELLYGLCEKQLLPAKNVDDYMVEAEKRKNTEIKALLLNYQQILGNEKLEKARAEKEKAKQDYADGVIERLAERDLSNGIEGLTFVVTGSLRLWENRDQVKVWLGKYGASLGTSITRKTDYLVTNDTASGSEKNRKAKAVGALVIDEEEFNHMVGWKYRNEETVTVPSWLNEIPPKAFMGNKNTKTVILPESIERIGTGAFAYCEELKNINIPKSGIWIDGYAFRGCKGLADSNGFVIVRDILYDYYGNDQIAKIPESVVRIEKAAFHNHSSLGTYLPLGWYHFRADEGVYKHSSNLESIVMTNHVKWIEESAFRGCKTIRSVVISDTVYIIEKSTFEGCSALQSVMIPGSVEKIGERAFAECTGLETVVVSDGVKNIEKDAFLGCSNLKTIDLPDSITGFGTNALPGDHVYTVRASRDSHAMNYAKRRKLELEIVG